MSRGRALTGSALKVLAEAADRFRSPPRGLVLLIYHRVGGGSGSSVDLPVDVFERQVEWLAESGRATTLDAGLAQAASGDPPEADPVVVTVDDGTADFVDVVVPILDRWRLPALLYLATDFVERGRAFSTGPPASWAGLRDAVATGLVTIGSHTHTHRLLDRLAVPEAIDDLDRSTSLIRERLGVDAAHFAYPKAVLGSPGVREAVRARFRSAAIAGTRSNPYGRTDPFRLARSPIQVGDHLRWFHRKVNGGMAIEDNVRVIVNRRRYANLTT